MPRYDAIFAVQMDMIRKAIDFRVVRGTIPTRSKNLTRCVHPLVPVIDGCDVALLDSKILSRFQKIAVGKHHSNADESIISVLPGANHIIFSDDLTGDQGKFNFGKICSRIRSHLNAREEC